MSKIVNDSWMPPASPKRVIVHWTAGGASASALDRAHYHILVEQDLDLVRGDRTIADNDNTNDGVYAAHVLGANKQSIGVSLCGMAGAVQSPFNPGTAPINEAQWDRAAQVVADLCERYGIPISPQTVLQHGEVEVNLGVTQRGKWDVCKLPWVPAWTPAQVCADFRSRVGNHMGAAEAPAGIKGVVLGFATTGVLQDSQALVALRPLDGKGIFTFQVVSDRAAVITQAGRNTTLDFYNIGGVGYVPAKKLATFLGAQIAWDAATQTVTISK